MKNKIIVLTLSVLLIIFSIFVTKGAENRHRYHEHLEKKSITENYDYSKINKKTRGKFLINRKTIKSHLPIADLYVDEKTIPGLNKHDTGLTDASFKISENDKEILNTKANIRYRGNSSLKFDKKGYLVKFVNDDGTNRDEEVLGMSKNNEWVLHGPYLDKTLIRNYMWYNISGEILEYSPNCRFIELFVNDVYKGIYLVVEKITVSKYGRLNIDRAKKDSKATSFLIELVTKKDANGTLLHNLSKKSLIMDKDTSFEVKYPTKNKQTEEHIEYITNYINDFEKTLYSYDYDNGNRSTYFYKDNKGKIKLSIWDMNNIFDNFFLKTETNTFIMKDKLWFNMLLKDKKFTNKIITRYRELRKGILSDEYLENYTDESINYLGPAIERNYVRWASSFEDRKNFMIDSNRNIHSYNDAVKQYKDTMHERLKWLDENIESLKQFSHESNVKSYNP